MLRNEQPVLLNNGEQRLFVELKQKFTFIEQVPYASYRARKSPQLLGVMLLLKGIPLTLVLHDPNPKFPEKSLSLAHPGLGSPALANQLWPGREELH